LVLSTKLLVAAAKFLVAATNILFVVPNFVVVTKPFSPCRLIFIESFLINFSHETEEM